MQPEYLHLESAIQFAGQCRKVLTSFLYTECQSPGPYKIEPGFKIKSIALWNNLTGARLDHEDESLIQAEPVGKLVELAVGTFPQYQAPNFSPFASREEFYDQETYWSFYGVSPDRLMLLRQATSGTSYGRPGNPFHQGLILEKDQIPEIIRSSYHRFGITNLRPTDYLCWDGWLMARGEQELEAASLGGVAEPLSNLELFSYQHDLESSVLDSDGSLMSLVETRLHNDLDPFKNLRINRTELGTLIAVSHCLPASAVWNSEMRLELTSEGISQRNETEENLWSNLLFSCIESDLYSKVEESTFSFLGKLLFSKDDKRSWLWQLPLSILALPDVSSHEGFDFDSLNAACENFSQLASSVMWGDYAFKLSVLEKIRNASHLGQSAKIILEQTISAQLVRS